MRKLHLLSTFAVVIIGTVLMAQADVPQLINYQGVLISGGSPVTTTTDVIFAIWDDPSTGDSLWSEQRAVTPDADGLFNILLGASSPIPDSAFGGSERYLSVKVDTDPEMSPRQQIVSVGYAYRVNSVDGSLGGVIQSKVTIGEYNTNTGDDAFVAGFANAASGPYSVIGGGLYDTNLSTYGVVCGGSYNVAGGSQRATIVGGDLNRAEANYAFVGAGSENSASGVYSGIVSGRSNVSAGDSSFVGGGSSNKAGGQNSTVSGGMGNNALGNGSTVGGGWQNTAAMWSTVSGGLNNDASGAIATIGGGANNMASGMRNSVGGGEFNVASASDMFSNDGHATVGGGKNNVAEGVFSVVSGGALNTARGRGSFVAGGLSNVALGDNSVVSGGALNTARGSGSFVAGGLSNVALGDNSFVAGSAGKANHPGSMVFSAKSFATDSDSVSSGGIDQMVLRADGGIYLTNTAELAPYDATNIITTRGGAYLSGNGTNWTNSSDRNLKENFTVIDRDELMDKIAALEIKRWNYKGEGETVRHIGPVAQDFHALFGLGSDDRSISTVDPAGIALAAIQELHKKTQKIEELEARLEKLQARLDKIAAEQE